MAQSISQEAIGATGLPGATAASRHAGATASGAPVSGTFAVGDYIIDQTGKIYVCTVAGTPGTWVQTGGGTYAPGTTVSSFISANVSMPTVGVFYNITSVTVTAGTWLIFYEGVFTNGGTTMGYDLWIGTSSASSTGIIQSISGYSASNWPAFANGFYSYVASTTTTIYLNASPQTTGSFRANFSYGQSITGVNNTGITAVRTA